MRFQSLVSAAALAALSGVAAGQPVIDGVLDQGEYVLQFVQNQPTFFGDNRPGGPCDPNDIGNPEVVLTGIEWAIPLAALGNPNVADIRIAGFITPDGYDAVSNQVIGGLTPTSGNFGDSRSVNFGTATGNQFVGGIQTIGGAPPVIDGTVDSVYGARLFTQTVRTGYGDSTDGNVDYGNGSEIDGLYAVVWVDPGDPNNRVLYLCVTGNLESNFNKLNLFLDVNPATGQNRLRGDNPDVDFDRLNRMGDDGSGNGLTFDAGFRADFWLGCGAGGEPYALYANYARLRPDDFDPGEGYYLGAGGAVTDGTLDGGNNPNNIRVTINNSNVEGVLGICPPPAGDRDVSNGSEIDAVWATAHGSRLYVIITGNLQTNYNKLVVFFDVQSGGQNTLRNDNCNVDFNGLNRMGPGAEGPGLTFDTDFSPDYFFSVTNGGAPPNVQNFTNASVLRSDGPLVDFSGFRIDYGSFTGGAKATNDPMVFDGPRLDIQDGSQSDIYANYVPRLAQIEVLMNPGNPQPPTDLFVSIDNSNTEGVTDTGVGDPAAVTTGIEFSVCLDELGWDGVSPIKMSGFIASGGYNFISNQVIGGLPGTPNPNLGEVRLIDFSTLGGNQYIVLDVSPCRADFNCDGQVDFFDYLDFVLRFADEDIRADFNRDGQVDFFDYLDFVQAFGNGC